MVADSGGVKQAEFKSPPSPQPAVVPIKREVEASPTAAMRSLYQKAVERHRTMDTYIMRLRRREVVAGKARPEELILVKFRQEPWSVYFKWIGPEAKGREVVHVKGSPGNEIHTPSNVICALHGTGARTWRADDVVHVVTPRRTRLTEINT